LWHSTIRNRRDDTANTWHFHAHADSRDIDTRHHLQRRWALECCDTRSRQTGADTRFQTVYEPLHTVRQDDIGKKLNLVAVFHSDAYLKSREEKSRDAMRHETDKPTLSVATPVPETPTRFQTKQYTSLEMTEDTTQPNLSPTSRHRPKMADAEGMTIGSQKAGKVTSTQDPIYDESYTWKAPNQLK
jgi:hypothetical protein